MTREQAMEWVIPALKHMWNEKNVKKILEALGQEPCEDCISRQAVEKITWEEPSYTDALNVLTEVRDKVRALPSVNPQPRTGRWIKIHMYEIWKCSECATAFRFTFKEHYYCPNCGAKME